MAKLKTLRSLNKQQESLLLFLETCVVDHAGAIRSSSMNQSDFDQAEKWHADGFIRFGRITHATIDRNSERHHWCQFSDEAWLLAQQKRRERAARGWERKHYETTEEKRNAS